jgi:hypothetical protein
MAPTESYYRASDGYRSFIDNHLVQGVSPPPARVFGDPGAGNLYFGQTNLDGSAGNNLGPSNHPTHYPRETFYGHRVGVNRDYFNNGSYSACTDAIAADLAKGRVPWKSIALSSPNILWSDFATGTGNTAWASFLADVDAIGKGPVMITIEHEPNPSTATGKTAADYKAMYVQAKTFTDLYPQILLTPVLTGGNFEITGSEKLQFSDWMSPAGADIFGFDSYNHVSYNPANGKKDLSVQQMFGQQAAQCHAMDPVKPWAVGEWGVRTGADGGRQAAMSSRPARSRPTCSRPSTSPASTGATRSRGSTRGSTSTTPARRGSSTTPLTARTAPSA